jgi:hypothetical protein
MDTVGLFLFLLIVPVGLGAYGYLHKIVLRDKNERKR